MMKSLIILTLLLSVNISFAGTCISLGDYNLTPASRFSASDQASFKQSRFEIYRSFVLNENKLTNYYSREIQNLYENTSSDSVLAQKVKALETQKQSQLAQNCNNHKKKLKDLINSF